MIGLILHYLQSHDYVKRPELLRHLHNMGIDCSDREMRKEIEAMVKTDGQLIQSSSKGYHLIGEDSENGFESVQYLRKKAFPILERAAALERNLRVKFDSVKQREIEHLKSQLKLML